MRRQYDDFIQLKAKDMSKAISDMTLQYINPETNEPTRVPAKHYEDYLDQIAEKYVGDVTKRQFLVVMYNQLNSLKKEDEKYFYQALMCLDLGLNPKDLRVDEQISLEYTYDGVHKMKDELKKDFHILNDYVVDTYSSLKNNSKVQAEVIRNSNLSFERENYIKHNGGFER